MAKIVRADVARLMRENDRLVNREKELSDIICAILGLENLEAGEEENEQES